MKVMMMALIGHENQILLDRHRIKSGHCHIVVEKEGAEKALEKSLQLISQKHHQALSILSMMM
jgi:hypothetical protein